MHIPSRLKFGAQTIKVMKHDTLVRTSDGEDLCGHASFTFGSIDLAESCPNEVTGEIQPLSESVIADTFLHEICHHIDSHFGLGLTENQVTGMASGLLDIIRVNKLDFLKV